jgi:hypothetical protein
MSFTVTNKMEMPPKELPITPDMGRGVAMCELTAAKGRVQHLKAELIVCGVATERELVNIKVNEMKAKLKKHELGESKKEFPLTEMTAIQYIKPWSKEMKDIMLYLGGLNDESDDGSDGDSQCSEFSS